MPTTSSTMSSNVARRVPGEPRPRQRTRRPVGGSTEASKGRLLFAGGAARALARVPRGSVVDDVGSPKWRKMRRRTTRTPRQARAVRVVGQTGLNCDRPAPEGTTPPSVELARGGDGHGARPDRPADAHGTRPRPRPNAG